MQVRKVTEEPKAIPEELEDESFKAIGLVKLTDKEDGGDLFVPFILHIDNGAIVKVVKLEPSFSASDAINDGTDWLDNNWWDL